MVLARSIWPPTVEEKELDDEGWYVSNAETSCGFQGSENGLWFWNTFSALCSIGKGSIWGESRNCGGPKPNPKSPGQEQLQVQCLGSLSR